METNAMTTTTETPVAIQEGGRALNFFDLGAFREAFTVAQQLAKSQLIPKTFQGNVTDCIIAMEMAQRIGAGVFAVMQSLYIVHGKPGWSATFIIGALNSCGRFAPLRFDVTEPKEKTVDGKKIMDRVCTAWTLEKGTGQRLEGPPVSIEMAHREGWYSKAGSKWQTMPELMLRYRAATFFGRLYAPDVLMGMRTAEELVDAPPEADAGAVASIASDLNARFGAKETIDAETGEIVSPADPEKAAEQPPVTAAPPAPAETEKPSHPEAQAPPPAEEQATATGQALAGPSAVVKAFMKEINSASAGGSVAVDTWRAKHHVRVAKACGGDLAADYKEIMGYAEIIFRELVESEKEQQGKGGDNGLF